MKKLALAFLILTSPPALAQTQLMQPGQWEITSTRAGMSMPGMEDMPPEDLAAMGLGQTTSFRYCLSPEDAAKGPGQATAAGNGSCKVIMQQVSGSSFEATLACEDAGAGPVQVHSKGTASPTGFDSTNEVTMASEGMTMSEKLSGKFLGSCN